MWIKRSRAVIKCFHRIRGQGASRKSLELIRQVGDEYREIGRRAASLLFCTHCGGSTPAFEGNAGLPHPSRDLPSKPPWSNPPVNALAGARHHSHSLEDDPDALAWQADMPLITNPFMIYDLTKVLGLGSLFPLFIIVALAFWEGSYAAIPALAGFCALIFGGLMFVSALIMLAVFGNRFPYEYLLDSRGVRMELRSLKANRISSLAILLGSLAGRRGLTAAGAGFLAKANRIAFLPWEELRCAHFFPNSRRINLVNDWRAVIRMEIPESLYSEIEARVRAELNRQEARRSKVIRPATAPAIRAILSLLTILFTVVLMGDEKPLAFFPGLALLAGLAGLAALWARGWKCFLAAALMVALMGGSGLLAWIHEAFVNEGQAGWAIALGIQVALMLFLVGIGLAILSGRVRTAPDAARVSQPETSIHKHF